MKKNYILDTNVLIHDPQSIFKFEDNNLYIPIYVLEELDKIKSEQTTRGRNSREACRILDEIRCQGSLQSGILLDNGGIIAVYVPQERKTLKVSLDHNSMDNAILQCALELNELSKDIPTILVTMDVNLRIRAESIGLQTASYENQSVDFSKLITGMVDIDVPDGTIAEFYNEKSINIKEDLYYNAYVKLKEPSGKTALGKYLKDTNNIRLLHVPKEGVLGIKPRNNEQTFAMDLLLDDEVKIVSLIGMAGCGKTILASSIGLNKVLNGKYNKLTIARPIVVLGNDIGFLPGTLSEKLDPYMQPIYDNLDLLLMGGGKKNGKGIDYEDFIKQGLIKVEPLTYIRGRSLHNQFVLIDESQNLSIHEMKTIITRCGEGTKIVLTGDPSQIDTPYLDKNSCGLSLIVEKMHNHHLVGHITLSKGERSKIANLATERLEK